MVHRCGDTSEFRIAKTGRKQRTAKPIFESMISKKGGVGTEGQFEAIVDHKT